VFGTAHAQQARSALAGGYAEVGYTQLKISDDEGGGDAKPGAIPGILGYNLHPNVAVEGMAAFGVRDDDVTETVATPFGTFTGTAEVKLRHAFGLYVKPKVDIGDAIEVFGRIGYTRAKLRASASVTVPGGGTASASESDSESGGSFGLGANFRFSPNAYVGIDWMRYLKKDGVKTEGVTIGVGYRF
jgi:outer membrane autotransporter protein